MCDDHLKYARHVKKYCWTGEAEGPMNLLLSVSVLCLSVCLSGAYWRVLARKWRVNGAYRARWRVQSAYMGRVARHGAFGALARWRVWRAI